MHFPCVSVQQILLSWMPNTRATCSQLLEQTTGSVDGVNFSVEGQQCRQRPDSQSNSSDADAFFDRQVRLALPAHLTAEERILAEVIQASILNVTPDVRWDDIAGLADAKKLLQEAVVYPMLYPQVRDYGCANDSWMMQLKQVVCEVCASDTNGYF